jgi:hypothetical protein
VTARTGELAGHLHSREPELVECALLAYVQTAELARRPAPPRLDYAIVPDEARAMIQAALDAKTPAEQVRLEAPLADRCLVPFDLVDLQARLVCLLPYGHDLDDGAGVAQPEHGWYRFIDARERGAHLAELAAERLEDRFEEARRRLR